VAGRTSTCTGPAATYQNATISAGVYDLTFQEWYSYNSGEARVGKEVLVSRTELAAATLISTSYT
jgi:hypothetical protein